MVQNIRIHLKLFWGRPPEPFKLVSDASAPEPLHPWKENHKELYVGKLKNDSNTSRKFDQGSVNDDLENLITKLSKSESIFEDEDDDVDDVHLFFTPMLTKEELKLVEQKDEAYLLTYSYENPDVDPEEMKKSDSKNKFVYSSCWRRTKYLTTTPQIKEEFDLSKLLAKAEAALASWTSEDYERANRRPVYPFDK